MQKSKIRMADTDIEQNASFILFPVFFIFDI